MQKGCELELAKRMVQSLALALAHPTGAGMKQDPSSVRTGRCVSTLPQLHAEPSLSAGILLSFLSLPGALAEPCTAQPGEISETAYAHAYVLL